MSVGPDNVNMLFGSLAMMVTITVATSPRSLCLATSVRLSAGSVSMSSVAVNVTLPIVSPAMMVIIAVGVRV